jgi:2-polyprenyl-3-methyl-5-hydroxy-6-metoxy-1,4-benzoquinol methylase
MTDFDKETATADELWDHCLKEYESQNPIVQYLYNNFYSNMREIVYLLDEKDQILEVGCGAGASSFRLHKMLSGQRFEASDVDKRYVRKLKETDFPLPVLQESVLQLSRKDHAYDCVFMLEVLEHLEEYERALSELFRVSRKFVVISVPNEPLWRILNMVRGKYLRYWGNTPAHINHWSRSEFMMLISRYGTILKVYTPVPWIVVLAQVKYHYA